MPSPSKQLYTPELALSIIERVAEGETLREILPKARPGMPSQATFHQWLTQYPELKRAYVAAREISALVLEEEALTLARGLVTEKFDAENRPIDPTTNRIKAVAVAMDQYRWSATRRDPRSYGNTDANAKVGIAVQINTSLALPGEQNAIGSSGSYTVDITPEPEPSPPPLFPLGSVADAVSKLDPSTYGEPAISEKFPGLAAPGRGDFITRKPPGRPKGGRTKHKTAQQTASTIAAYARRKTLPGKPAANPKDDPDDGTDFSDGGT